MGFQKRYLSNQQRLHECRAVNCVFYLSSAPTTKSSATQDGEYSFGPELPPAPAIYRPQLTPRVLQTKRSVESAKLNQARLQNVAPPVCRPEATKLLQPKAIMQLRKPPTAPPVYRPNKKCRAAQMAASALTHSRSKTHPFFARRRTAGHSVVQNGSRIPK